MQIFENTFSAYEGKVKLKLGFLAIGIVGFSIFNMVVGVW